MILSGILVFSYIIYKRKIAKNDQNHQNFTVKKRNFFIYDSIGLKFELDLNIIESKFPIDFQHPSTKFTKLTFFFTKSGYFCDAVPQYFENLKIVP